MHHRSLSHRLMLDYIQGRIHSTDYKNRHAHKPTDKSHRDLFLHALQSGVMRMA